MKSKFYSRCFVFILLAFSASLLNPILSQTLTPTADAYVRGGDYASETFYISNIIVASSSAKEATANLADQLQREALIYPNPVSNELNIENDEGAELTLYNLIGKTILKTHLTKD